MTLTLFEVGTLFWTVPILLPFANLQYLTIVACTALRPCSIGYFFAYTNLMFPADMFGRVLGGVSCIIGLASFGQRLLVAISHDNAESYRTLNACLLALGLPLFFAPLWLRHNDDSRKGRE